MQKVVLGLKFGRHGAAGEELLHFLGQKQTCWKLINKNSLEGTLFFFTCYINTMTTFFFIATAASPTHCEVVRLRLLLIGPALGQGHFGGGTSSWGLVR